MFTKKSKTDDENLVLVETQELEEKCGKCNTNLVLKVYWSNEGYTKQIECTKCEISVWKDDKKS